MRYIKIGKIVNTHGIKGELRILSNFPHKEEAFKVGMPIYIEKENKEIINSYRKHKNFDMITLKGYSNINEVLKYKGKNAYIKDEDIKLSSDKYLDEDIIGLEVIFDNKIVGIVSNIERYDKISFLVVLGEKESLIPYNYDLIEKIDTLNNKIYIKYIKGLFE